jgi:cytoskeletal protein CcmA (bactofilin family)
VLIGPHGKLDGNLECKEGEIMGYIKGTIRVDGLLYLRGEALVTGDVQTAQFEMEPTVKFNGRCQMADTASHVTSKGELTIVEQEKATRRAAEKETAVLG